MSGSEGVAVPGLDQAWHALPRAHGAPPVTATLRACPEDFRVREDLGIVPDGQGEHLWMRVRKTGWNTADVAAWLAESAGCTTRDVTWAGLKDRRAVTEQWFGVHLPGRTAGPEPTEAPAGIEVLEQARNTRKLRTGMLRGNAFELTLRDGEGAWPALGERLMRIACFGVPNYFGEQRFGHGGGNLAGAWRLFGGERLRSRHRRGLYLSAARSFLFNAALAQRVEQGSWDRPLPGDVMTFTTSGSLFRAHDLAPGDPRLASGDIHPTGPLPGRGGTGPDGEARAVEDAVLGQWPEACQGLERLGVDAARRALRVPVRDLYWYREGSTLVLGFWLPAGAYATAVLRECVAQRERSRT